ncbi:MAG: hypothetical protein ACD_13C00146G0008 [uncultured bacterium]|nr:MAG: hypothetical protein ACD_13C00146G0008 [uncultured bacterium]KKR53804.1 MAG: hypothetical protein UT88_C0006G0043 [Candidatus Woesebacteria bacterium GW2011_GWD2_40_19]KKR58262.1 MAG: hypothetical protein UT96_C0008G0003 [Candidatus Woesebacteria bacterium GW2011_GWC2_40_30]HAU65412.1 hypothetical protein [Candidatus Woesebacteria bacterium]HCC08373.1 hypothetical protein [Candidatus Woesebacteria bacterium]
MLKKYNQLISLIDELAKDEDLKPGKKDILKRALKELFHALDTKNIKGVRKAIDQLSKELLIVYHP